MPIRVRGAFVPFDPRNATLGIRLRFLRRRLGVTIAQFATRARLNYKTVARLEKDSLANIKPWVLSKVFSAFGDQVKKTFSIQGDIVDWAIPPATFGGWLCNLRLRRGLQQSRLAGLIGASRAALYKYEHNLSKPRDRILERLELLFKDEAQRMPKDWLR
ncbi:MAG: helix-turn-helix domain-containing protein [Elusimicrobia bacterium]|nr:helix-turn-helix domain-containing protein [Elusimicrobiota bacterium]